MGDVSEFLPQAIKAATESLQSIASLEDEVALAADMMEQCLRAGNKMLVCGNGGSAADAAHFATEFVVRFAKDRRAYPVIALAGDGGLLTAAGNDYGFDEIFARIKARNLDYWADPHQQRPGEIVLGRILGFSLVGRIRSPIV